MPRFSSQAKKIFTLIWYKADIEQSKGIFKELTSNIDITSAKLWFAYYFFTVQQPDFGLQELKEAEQINRSHPDTFNSFTINWHYFYYFIGFHLTYPMVSLELAKQYFSKLEASYKQIDYFDDWEKHFCEGIYYEMNAAYVQRIEMNLEKGISYIKKSKESFRLIPEDGYFFSKVIGNVGLAYFQRSTGQFNESEMNYQIASQEAENYASPWQLFSLFNLTNLNIQKGDLNKAMEFNEKCYVVSKKFNYTPGIYIALGVKGDLFYQKGKYNKALELYQESLINRKQYSDPLEIFMGYLDLFWFYYQSYKINKEQEYFKKTEETFFELKKIKEQYPDDTTIRNYANFSEARIFKYGNFTKRAKSVMLFEELMKIWPHDYDIIKEYLELLFEEFLLSEDKETMGKIDFLMKKIIDLPLSINSIYSYVSQQIMLARYQFFIEDDISSAFDILDKAIEKISPYKIERFNSQLEQELMNFKNERTKWEKADYSVKERIRKSEFQKYIQDALNIKLG